MQLEFTYSDGMVRIKDVETPNIPAALDFSAPAGAFYSVLSDGGNPLTDTMTIWHEHGSLPVVSFKAGECAVPAGANFTILKPLIDAILSQSTPTPATPMTPINTVYVSGVQGSPTGTGAIDSPLDTIAAAIVLANTNSFADGIPWCVYVFSGTYDEPIIVPASADTIWITLGCGAEVIYSGGGGIAPTIDATNGDTYITMHQGSVIANTGSGAVIYPDVNDIVIVGNGTIRQDSPYQIIDMTAIGNVTIRGCTLLNTDVGNNTSMIDQAGGILRLVDVNLISLSANAPITKSGGTAILMNYRNYSPVATNYAESPTPQDIQISSCFTNVNKGPQITETVEPIKHDAGFVI